MEGTAALAVNALNLALVVAGFTLIIVIHELGHFLAARWAGIRVLAFAVGFGPALLSYRKGLGWRRGSSDAEYRRIVEGRYALRTDALAGAARVDGDAGVSPTEYRLNTLPFGGYVKMLGQDDADPAARSDEPDSYQSAPPWKRMVVISAGVAMNILTAAALFMTVFLVGLKMDAPTIGFVQPGSPASTAVAEDAGALGPAVPGLQPGDEVLSIDGERPMSFNDIMLASAMARPGRPIEIEVRRPEFDRTLRFSIIPRTDKLSKMLQIGVLPSASGTLQTVSAGRDAGTLRYILDSAGLATIDPGARLETVNGQPARGTADPLALAALRSGGQPMDAEFTRSGPGGASALAGVTLRPDTEFQELALAPEPKRIVAVPHLLGLAPAMRVDRIGPNGAKAGLMEGDVFLRLGTLELPTLQAGSVEIGRHKRSTIDAVVLRSVGGVPHHVALDAIPVDKDGLIGFRPGGGQGRAPTWLARLPAWPAAPGADPVPTPAAALDLLPGSRITAVAGRPVSTFNDLRIELNAATGGAAAAGSGAAVELTVETPVTAAGGDRPTRVVRFDLSAGDVKGLHALGWSSPLPPYAFEPSEVTVRAEGPLGAVKMGLRETKRVMLSTYVTFARLFQGSVKVGHLKGPVGIAHVGTIFASRGPVWLLFFLALVSVNLAVINFLPIPIADGGHMVYLLYEQLTGRPVSPSVQNAAAFVGLGLILCLFLFVTFNDISNLFKP